MTIFLPSADVKEVTVLPGEGYSITYFQDIYTTTSKVTQNLMFICLDLGATPETSGIRCLDISKSDAEWGAMWVPICLKDILNIVPKKLADVNTELLADMQTCNAVVDNPLTDGSCAGGTPPAFPLTQTLIYN